MNYFEAVEAIGKGEKITYKDSDENSRGGLCFDYLALIEETLKIAKKEVVIATIGAFSKSGELIVKECTPHKDSVYLDVFKIYTENA